MIVVHESASASEMNKPVICYKCKRGKLGSIPAWSKAVISRRGKPPPKESGESVQVKCAVCGMLWSFTIK